MSYAIVFRAYPDVDHMAPLAWRLLEDGEEVYAVISPGYRAASDYRLRFLSGYSQFHLVETAPPSGSDTRLGGKLARARGIVRRTIPWAIWFLLTRRIRVVCVEWGNGLRPGYERLRSLRGAADVLRSFAGSVRRLRDPQLLRSNFMVAARLLGRPTVCLPHGLSIKVGRRSEGGKLLAGPYDWRDRNRFAAYVLNTEHQREWFLARAHADPAVVQTWGSLRWDPQWFEINRKLAPKFEWPADAGERVKVVFMVPKWANFVDVDATLELVKRLQQMDEVALAIKGHPRPEDGSADPLRDDPQIDWSRIEDVTGADSVSVIDAAHVVIDVGSSIGIEAVMQHKVLINPSYIHDFVTLFDQVPGSCVVAQSAEDVVSYLRAHAGGSPHTISDLAYRELLQRGVYGSRSRPFDVLGTYSERVRALAGAVPN